MNQTNEQAQGESPAYYEAPAAATAAVSRAEAAVSSEAERPTAEAIADAPPDPVQEAVQTIAALHARAERRVDNHQRMIERVSSTIGRPASLYLVLLAVGLWMGFNGALHANGKNAWDAPPFYWMQGVIGLAALLTTLMVVITQHRQDITDERRGQLDLQISLVIEQKTTKLIALVEELRRDLPNVQNRADPEAEKMTESADPQVMLIALEHMLNEAVEEIGDLQEAADGKQSDPPSTEEASSVMPKPTP